MTFGPVGVLVAYACAEGLRHRVFCLYQCRPARRMLQMWTKGVSMHAKPGDHLVIQGHHVGDTDKEGEILEARGESGQPPFLVRWADDERETLVFPGSDALVQHSRRKRPKKATG